jgi:hypothetical protein
LHYVPVLARKPGALRNGAPFKDWVLPAAMERGANWKTSAHFETYGARRDMSFRAGKSETAPV